MTNRPLSTVRSNSNGFGLWMMSLLLVCAEANSDRFCDNRPDRSFDFFYFVQQWPGAFCSRGCCFASSLPLPAARFGIHGLWPAHFGGMSPCYCSSRSFWKMDYELERTLQKHWVAMQCPNYPNMLYMHGWKKHGTCSGMDQAYYFQTAINLHLKYNILRALKDAGVYPDGRFYNLGYMQQALGNVIGEDPVITCSFNQQHQVSQIYEVYICLDKEKLLPFQCPDNPNLKTNCRKKNALFPAFDPRSTSPSPISAPTGSPIRFCTDPNSMNELTLRLSGDEESLQLYLDRCDSKLGMGDEEFQNFLGNRTVDELEVDHDILEQC